MVVGFLLSAWVLLFVVFRLVKSDDWSRGGREMKEGKSGQGTGEGEGGGDEEKANANQGSGGGGKKEGGYSQFDKEEEVVERKAGSKTALETVLGVVRYKFTPIYGPTVQTSRVFFDVVWWTAP
jgi:hypothetical protein